MIPSNCNALAIDPGYAKKSKGCACAKARSGRLVKVWFERARDFRHPNTGAGEGFALDHVFVEQPQQDGRSWEVPPAVLIRLSWEGALLAGLYTGASGAVLHDPTVSEWKGSESKPAMHRRLWKVLDEAERKVLGGAATLAKILAACEKGALCRWSKPGAELYPSTYDGHNLLDAAAELMWALGRLEKVG